MDNPIDYLNRTVTLTEYEIEQIVTRGVSAALTRLGIDTAHPLDMQKDFSHLRAWRMSTDQIKDKGMLALMGIILSGFFAAVWLGFKTLIKQ
jgi:hypothetical protein